MRAMRTVAARPRGAAHGARRAGRALVPIAVLLALAGCSREPPRFIPPEADSTLAVEADSFAVLVADARERWESVGGSEAATPTVRLLISDLRRHPDLGVAARARTFVDSCGFSAEIAGGPEVAMVNLFSRADPASGSWPHLVWRDEGGVRHQAVEGGSLRLLDFAVHPATGPGMVGDGPGAAAQVAAVFARSSGRGQQPVAIVWRLPPEGRRWLLAQTLGPDSLGGVGEVAFVRVPGGGIDLEARTYRPTAGFDECPTCPHVHRLLRFAWAETGFEKISEETSPSPYRSFVRLIAALSVNDRELALGLVTDPSLLDAAERYEWGRSKGLWRVAPGTEESSSEMTMFRGTREAYKVRFASSGGDWLISDLQPTRRTIE